MTSKQDQAAQLLRLPDADYFSISQDRQLKLQSALAALVKNGQPAGESVGPSPIVAIGAPSKIDTEQHDSIPLLIGQLQTGLQAWEVNSRTNLHLFVRNLSTGELAVIQPLVNMRRGQRPQLSGVGTPPAGAKARTLYASVSPVNLRDKIKEFSPGPLSVTAVLYELLSNRIGIELRGGVPAAIAPTTVQPYVRYNLEQQQDTAKQVEIPKTASAKDGISIRVRVTVDAGVELSKQPSGQTFWTFHIVLVQLDERAEIIPVTIPVLPDNSRIHSFSASFELDLRAAARSQLTGKYQVYVDLGPEILGPYPLSVTQ